MPKALSCGVLCYTNDQRLLLCHPTGQDFWDIPKGKIEEGETERQAAIRELREETGIISEARSLIELGPFSYNNKKRLHLFKYLLPVGFNVSSCYCTSNFQNLYGITQTEMDDWWLVPFQETLNQVPKSLNRVLDLIFTKELL